MVDVLVSENYQIELPEEARRRLGIQPGDRLRLDLQDDQLLLRREPQSHEARLWGLHSEIWEGVDVDEYIRHERESWEG